MLFGRTPDSKVQTQRVLALIKEEMQLRAFACSREETQ
jgi:hypothetical protein